MQGQAQNTRRTALVTGITGQDGSYLAEMLVAKGYHVTGVSRSAHPDTVSAISAPLARAIARGDITVQARDLSEPGALLDCVGLVQPAELYHLAGQSHVGASFETPVETLQHTAMAAAYVLDAVRATAPGTRVLMATSGEMFGAGDGHPLDENSVIVPASPYGTAKAMVAHLGAVYRAAYGAFVCCAICFNHESPRRPSSFVTRKVSRAVARIVRGSQETLKLGTIEVIRDWGYAPEYVDAMWRMLQKDAPGDYVLASGRAVSLAYFVEQAFDEVGLDWRDHVETDPVLVRPTDPPRICGNPDKAQRQLDWRARTDAGTLARLMVRADLDRLSQPNGA